MLGKSFVDEGVVGAQQIEHAAILAQDAVEQEGRFVLKSFAQRAVEAEDVRVRSDRRDVADVQPLSSEVVHERLRPRIVQHALHLLLEGRGIAQAAVLREIEQPIVGDRAPEKERKPRRELDIADALHAAAGVRRIVLDAEQEFRRHEERFERLLDPGVEVTRMPAALVEREQRRDVGRRHRPAKGAMDKRRQDGARARRFVARGSWTAHENPFAARGVAAAGDGVRSADRDLGDLAQVGGALRQCELLQPGAVEPQIHSGF